jgi:hypothetical protein
MKESNNGDWYDNGTRIYWKIMGKNQGCGSGLIFYGSGSGSSIFSQSGSGSKLKQNFPRQFFLKFF